MTEVKVLGSSSRGNGYILDHDGDRLVIECGVKVEKALAAMGYDISGCAGAVVSHSHGDHAGQIKRYLKYFPVYSTPEAAEAHPGVVAMEPQKKYRLGRFFITPLEVPHTTECYAYVIEIGGERILFATDCRTFPYSVPSLTAVMIECNYSEEIRRERIMAGEDVRSDSSGHCELAEAEEIVRRLQSPKLNAVVLLHLSAGLSDEKAFISRIQRVTAARVDIAATDGTYSLSEDF